MKIINIIRHPYTVVITFLFIMISGQHLGGFYFLYLLLALPHFSVHSLLGTLGVILLLIIHLRSKKNKVTHLKSMGNIFCLILMLLSLFFFFYNDKEHYNYGTFYQLVPQISLILFSIVAFSFVVFNLIILYRHVSEPTRLDNRFPHL
jgi:hypothetical protein